MLKYTIKIEGEDFEKVKYALDTAYEMIKLGLTNYSDEDHGCSYRFYCEGYTKYDLK